MGQKYIHQHEKYINELVRLGCDRDQLLRHLEDFMTDYDPKQTALLEGSGVDIAKKQFYETLEKMRETASNVRLLQQQAAHRVVEGRAIGLESVILSDFVESVDLMERCADVLKCEVEHNESLCSVKFSKAVLINYVLTATGKQPWTLLSYLLREYAEFKNIKPHERQKDSTTLSPGALQHFWDRSSIENELGKMDRQRLDFTSFIEETWDLQSLREEGIL
jgi:hypothetical protein